MIVVWSLFVELRFGKPGRFWQKHTRMNKKFCNILVDSSLQCVYQVTEAMQGDYRTSLYHGSWYAETLHIISLCAWFETHINKRATLSNSENYALGVQTTLWWHRSNKKHSLSKKWRHRWLEYSNQIIQEILLRL